MRISYVTERQSTVYYWFDRTVDIFGKPTFFNAIDDLALIR